MEQPRWPYLATAVEMAFAIHAAQIESTTRDILDSLSGSLGGSEQG